MSAPGSGRDCPQCGFACDVKHVYCPACGFPVGEVGTDRSDRLVGKTLPGGYQILDLISVGGMGRVYRAEQRALGRTVAVKVIHPHLLNDDNSIARFMTEARASSQLNHPNSVSVIDFGRTEDGQPYLVMEFLRGKDLARVAYEQWPMPMSRIVDVLKQVLAALAEAHELDIIHRDLKPENIIVEPTRRGGDFVKVVDFGLAKLRTDGNKAGVTLPGIVCGTPDYMSPEQGRGDPIDGRSDLYAVGVVLFQLLTGRLPFEHENPTQVVMMHISSPVPDPNLITPGRRIPEALVRVLGKALEKDAEDRYQDALEFSDALTWAMDQARAKSEPLSSTSGATGERAVVCPECRSRVAPTRFCGECGARIARRSEAPDARTDAFPPLPLRLQDRDADLAWLQARREDAADKLGVCAVLGDLGMGKTRLLTEFLDRARDQGDRVVEVCPDPYCAEVPLHGLRAAVVGLVGSDAAGLATEPAQRAGLALVFQGLLAPDRTPVERHEDLAAALLWALRCARARAPSVRLVLSLDDLDRLDNATRRAFGEVLRADHRLTGVLIVVSHGLHWEPNWPEMPTLRLAGLSVGLVEKLLGSRPLPARDLDDSTGVLTVAPLYVDQVVRFLSEGGTEPPARLADLMVHRIGRLAPAARRCLQALAVLGERASRHALSSLLGSDASLDGTIGELVRGGMIEQTHQSLTLGHPLLRELILASTPLEVRRELHQRSFRLLAREGAPLEVRALHAYGAEEAFEALLLAEQVAERALAVDDAGAAVHALRRGLDLARQELARGQLDDPLRAIAIFGRKLGHALELAGNYSDAEGVLRETLDVVGPTGRERTLVEQSLTRVMSLRSAERAPAPAPVSDAAPAATSTSQGR